MILFYNHFSLVTDMTSPFHPLDKKTVMSKNFRVIKASLGLPYWFIEYKNAA